MTMLSSPNRISLRRLALLGATVLTGASAPLLAQAPSQGPALSPGTNATTPSTTAPTSTDVQGAGAPVAPAVANGQVTPPPGTVDPNLAATPNTTAPSGQDVAANEIVVTGYRKSLAESATAKRDATSFTDSIFAEDIGKFPDTNIAESFNRIPGITIVRDITGEGVNVAIRGLGSNFTEVTLNGAPIAIASSGATDAQGTDRSVDLSFFPTDLFTKLTVNKSYTADLLEGGAAGNVDIRSARPFDRPGTHFTVNAQGVRPSTTGKVGERGSLIFSTTSDTLGILAGVSGQREFTYTPGYETIGYTNPNLSAAQCGATTGCNSTGGGNWTIPSVVPANAGNGLVAGTTIDQAFLLAHNPGATIQQIDNGILPRLGRPSAEFGERDRLNAIVSAEWRPSDSLHFYIDGMYGYKKNNLQREDIDWIVRNGSIIPLNETFDTTNCSSGCTVTGGTFANAQFFLEYRPYIETTHYYGVNPGAEWKIASNLKFDLNGSYTRSTFHRESPTVGPVTLLGNGTTVTYKNDGGIPSITSNLDLDDPSSYVWQTGGRVNIQDERRLDTTKGARGDLTWGDDHLNLKVGGNYDDIFRRITGYDNSQAFQNEVCGDNPSAFVASPNSQPPCNGISQTGAAPAGYPTYPGYGTGSTAGQTGPVTYGGSVIPSNMLANYLQPGPDGFVTVNWAKFAKDTNYAYFHNTEPSSSGANTGASGGSIREKTPAAYAELNGKVNIGGNDLRYNIGVRYVHTDQLIGGQVSIPDPRNSAAGAPADGGKYPNLTTNVVTENQYHNWLPAMNLAYDVGRHAVARLALSETMTRPDPSAQLPGVSFTDPSAQQANVGNPALKPYISKNIDAGFEYYTGQEGVVSFDAFRKSVTGFTNNTIVNAPFSSLAQYGITYDTLTPTQQAAITARGGPDAAIIQVQEQLNVPNKLNIDGLEFQWVQPLDFLTSRFGVRGFGFNANATIVDQSSSGPAIAYGVAPYTYNITGYYDHNGISLRVSTTFRKGSQASSPNQNGIPTAAIFNANYQEWDFSSIFDMSKIFGIRHAPELTFDIVNFTDSKLRQYFQYSNATFTEYKPGKQFLIGIRGTF